MSSAPFLFPNVTSLPSQNVPGEGKNGRVGPGQGQPGEFDEVFGQAAEKSLAERKLQSPLDKSVEKFQPVSIPEGSLDQIRAPLRFSAHASQRLKERKIALDPQTLTRVNDAVDKAAAKGIEDTLVLTSEAALIVSVKNRTVVTAMDRNSIQGNVFTNIDGAIVV